MQKKKITDILIRMAGFAAVAAGVLIQLLLFDRFCRIERNSMWLSVLYNCIPAILIGGLCYLPKRKAGGITIAAIALTVSSIWLICNCMYYRVNGLFITWQVAQMASNLHGYESSISACWSWKLLALPITGLLSISAMALLPYERKAKGAMGIMGAALALYLISVPLKYANRRNMNNRFCAEWFSLTTVPKDEGEACSMEYGEHIYMKMHSGLTYLLTFCKDAVWKEGSVELSEEDRERIEAFIQRKTGEEANEAAEGHLLYVLVESMEGWIMETTDLHGEPICPNLKRWAESHPCIYTDKVFSQKVYGESGDGQLICTTGMLPIDNGLTCNLYGTNTYPNFAHFYPKSAIISPSTYMYNREITTYSYGFQELIEPVKETPWWNDNILVDKTIEYLSKADKPACVMALTVDSHMPFTNHNAEVDLADSIEGMERGYIRVFRHVDEELGRLLSWADTAACMENATIVITGDHYTWYEGFSGRPRSCPLIMTGPAIRENIAVEEMYQMDIYTTLLDALGQTDYYWQGFGVSALKTDMRMPVAEQERPCSAQEALYLSNLMIRTNYFGK